MTYKDRKNEIKQILEAADENELKLVDGLIDEMIFLEDRMRELKKMPFIAVHPMNKAMQKQTPAAKQYKECSASYKDIIRVLLSVIRKADTSAQDELLKKLEEFA